MAQCAVLTNDLQYDLVNKNDERKEAVEAFRPRFTAFLRRDARPRTSTSSTSR